MTRRARSAPTRRRRRRAIANRFSAGVVTVTNSTITGNSSIFARRHRQHRRHADGDEQHDHRQQRQFSGGGIVNSGGTVTVTNTIVAGNAGTVARSHGRLQPSVATARRSRGTATCPRPTLGPRQLRRADPDDPPAARLPGDRRGRRRRLRPDRHGQGQWCRPARASPGRPGGALRYRGVRGAAAAQPAAAGEAARPRRWRTQPAAGDRARRGRREDRRRTRCPSPGPEGH